jgi:hypothetical protein
LTKRIENDGEYSSPNLFILFIVDRSMMASSGLICLIKQLAVISSLVFTLSTLATPLPLPLPKLERRNPFTVYDPNGGEGLFSDSQDGTIRNIPEIDDDTHQKESIEVHTDMDELVKKYAPVFKLS